jgi:hypothetical protein
MLVDFSFHGYFFGVHPFLFYYYRFVFVFFPNSNLTYPTTYYMPSWPYLPIHNQPPLVFTYLLTRSPPNLFTPTHFLDFCPPSLYVYNLPRTPLYMPTYLPTYPNTLLPTCTSAMLLPIMNILTMWVLQCHIPNNLPTHPHNIQISNFKYAYVPRAYVKEPLCTYCISKKH